MEREKLDKILENHKLWLNDEGGERADLRNADLRNADLYSVNLSGADLRNTDLRNTDLRNADLYSANLRNTDLRNTDLRNTDLYGADLYSANLRNTDLYGADLYGADLRNTDLRNADLRNADLYGADLRNADLERADLSGADLRNTNLNRANLRNANLTNVKTDIYTVGYNLACPEEGSFIAYKKAGRYIIKLLIMEDSKRSSATTLKCRCDKAKVLDIKEIDTGRKIGSVSSDYNVDFVYRVGEIVKIDDFDEDRWNECSSGIHFFVNKQNAIQY